jgi:hypothetical protein
LDSRGSNAQIQLLRTGFKLRAINSSTPISTEEDLESVTQTLPAAESITAGTAVRVVNVNGTSMLRPCNNVRGASGAVPNVCVGIAMHDAPAGENLRYMITGTMIYVPTSPTVFTTGSSLYIGTNGKVTQVANSTVFLASAEYLQKVGTVLSGNKIQVNIESAVQG